MKLAEKLRFNAGQNCPWETDNDDQIDYLTEFDPCPICGMLGTSDAVDQCVGSSRLLMAQAADELDRLLALIKQISLDSRQHRGFH